MTTSFRNMIKMWCLCKGSLHRPPSPQSLFNHRWFHPKPLTQFRYTSGNATDGHNPVLARIAILLRSSCPFAICRRVVTVITDPFNRLTRRTFTHVGQKCLKSIPSCANTDTPTAITGVSFVAASLMHVDPTPVGSGYYAIGSVAVSRKSPNGCILPQASTGAGTSREQVAIRHDKHRATFAQAPAFGPPAFCLGRSNNDKSCKSRVGRNRFSCTHSIASFNVVFSGGRAASTVRPSRLYKTVVGGQHH